MIQKTQLRQIITNCNVHSLPFEFKEIPNHIYLQGSIQLTLRMNYLYNVDVTEYDIRFAGIEVTDAILDVSMIWDKNDLQKSELFYLSNAPEIESKEELFELAKSYNVSSFNFTLNENLIDKTRFATAFDFYELNIYNNTINLHFCEE